MLTERLLRFVNACIFKVFSVYMHLLFGLKNSAQAWIGEPSTDPGQYRVYVQGRTMCS